MFMRFEAGRRIGARFPPKCQGGRYGTRVAVFGRMNPRNIAHSALALMLLTTAACERSASSTDPGQTTASASESVQVVDITAGADGFQPNLVQATKGQDLTLRFKRNTDGTCAKDVDFPELGIKRALPLNEAVAIRIPTSEARTIKFQCGMGMYESKVVIR